MDASGFELNPNHNQRPRFGGVAAVNGLCGVAGMLDRGEWKIKTAWRTVYKSECV